MSYYSVTRQRSLSTPPPIPQALIALAGGLALFVVLLGLVAAGYDYYYAGQIFPGVSVAGVDVAGMTTEEAAVAIAQKVRFPEIGRIVFQDGDKVWIARPAEVGLVLDAPTTALAAYNLGRQGNPILRTWAKFDAWYLGQDLPPLLVFDERMGQRYLSGIAAQVDLPTVEASLTVTGADVVVVPGQVGRQVDIQATMAPLEEQLRNLTDGLLPLVVVESPPAILDVSEQAEIARQILSAPLTLTLPEAGEGDPGPWTIEPQKLAELLTIERVAGPEGARYQVGLNAEGLRSFLGEIEPRLARYPADARFIFNDETRQLEMIQAGVVGRDMDVDATIQAINTQLAQGEHNVPLAVTFTQPAVPSNATAEQLGIRELVSQQTTYFYGSSASRIQNIETAASRFHGVLVPPGATFSMASVMGDVSLDNGYAEALIIYGNRTIKGVGGGVCQVSTTLFRTVFFGGYPIAERHPHAYRVAYYELNAANQVDTDFAGLDATVFVPVVDFKFTNDTPNWLLMETYTNVPGRSLTWKFYSTSEGRTVDWNTTGLQNRVDPPEPLYTENADLEKGEIRQVDWEVAGADVNVDRTVYRNGEVYFEDSFSTHYLPWRSVYEYGPGTKIEGETE